MNNMYVFGKKMIAGLLLIAFIGFNTPFVFADQPTGSLDSIQTDGNPCLGIPLSVSGAGTVSPANDKQISQYFIQVIWGPSDIQTGIPLITDDTTSPFSYTFNAGPHTYVGTPADTVTVQLYHQSPNGNDNQVDDTQIVPTCPPNEAPVFTNSPVVTSIDELVEYTFDFNATDPENNPLTFLLSGNPAGSTIDASTGIFSWTPTEAQGEGVYTFLAQVTDGELITTQEVSITVKEVNAAPAVGDLSVVTPMNTSVDVVLIALDTDVPVNTLIYEIVTGPSHGSASLSENTVVYTPDENYTGSDSFTWKASDGSLDSNNGTVTVMISNDAPQLDAIGGREINEHQTLSFSATATDPNEDTLTFSLKNCPVGANITPEGVFSWTPTESQDGEHTCTIAVSDGNKTDEKKFGILVYEVNELPVADPKTAEVDEDDSVLITLSGSDSDIPVQSLSFITETLPSYGTLSVIEGTLVTYTPNTNYTGIDSFTYTAFDGVGSSISATVNITVKPTNDAPTIVLNGSEEIALPFDAIYEEEGALCADIDGENLMPIITGSVNTALAGVYALSYVCTDQGGLSSETLSRIVTVQEAPAQCSDGKDNDGDGAVDYPADLSCLSPEDNDESNEALQCLVYSDTTHVVKSTGLLAKAVSFINENWVSIPNALWMWKTAVIENPEIEQSETFVKKITLVDVPGSAVMNIAADNGFLVTINGVTTIDKLSDEYAFTSVGKYNITPYLVEGLNTIEITVRNAPFVDATPEINPAGFVYTLDIRGAVCGENTGPLVNAGENQSKTLPTTTATLSGSATDSDGVIISYLWEQVSGPEGVIISSPTKAESGLTGLLEGTYVFKLTATDNDGVSASDEISIVVSRAQSSIVSSGVILGGSGRVLGASAGQVLGDATSCGIYLNDYLKMGANNDKEEVKKLQQFLNTYMGSTLLVDGIFGGKTFASVKAFQAKEKDLVLNPWKNYGNKTGKPTGYVYKTTKTRINNIMCETLNLQIPQLP